VLTLDLLGISEEDWNQMPAAGRVAIMFLLKQNQLLENRNYTYHLEVERLKTERALKAGDLSREGFQRKMEPVQARVKELIQGGAACDQAKTRRTCENLLKHEISLWTFVREEEVEPTNNNAERPLRRAVMWRRKSFGTQSESGSRFVERILTAITNLRRQGRDVLEYLTAVCRAALGQPSACCLLPNSS
jgi:transposase